MTAFHLASQDVAATQRYAAALAGAVQPGDAVVLTGTLGAGKTHFTQGFAAALGVAGAVVSPTFNILLTYEDGRLPLFHFDLYRLDDPDELEDTGYYDMLDGGGVTFIEWGDRFPGELPDDYVLVDISADASGLRTLQVNGRGARGNELAEAWLAALQAQNVLEAGER